MLAALFMVPALPASRCDHCTVMYGWSGMSHVTCYHWGGPCWQVEYREPVASVGRMPGGRAKIEGGPNQSEEDTALLIEKAILPLFAPGFTQNVTVSSTATTQHSPTALCLEPSQRLLCWCVLTHDSATIQHRPTAYTWSPVKGFCVCVC